MVTRPLLWPGENREYLLGSDMLGRDLLAGIFHGARVSLAIGGAGHRRGAGRGGAHRARWPATTAACSTTS